MSDYGFIYIYQSIPYFVSMLNSLNPGSWHFSKHKEALYYVS